MQSQLDWQSVVVVYGGVSTLAGVDTSGEPPGKWKRDMLAGREARV